MKKLIILLLLLGAGYAAFRMIGGKSEAPAPVHVPVQAQATAEATLNAVFPQASGGYKVTFTQEKDGFAQADLIKDGTKLASLAVSDTTTNPSARDKFKTAAKKIAGFPAAAVGTQGTAILVADR